MFYKIWLIMSFVSISGLSYSALMYCGLSIASVFIDIEAIGLSDYNYTDLIFFTSRKVQ